MSVDNLLIITLDNSYYVNLLGNGFILLFKRGFSFVAVSYLESFKSSMVGILVVLRAKSGG